MTIVQFFPGATDDHENLGHVLVRKRIVQSAASTEQIMTTPVKWYVPKDTTLMLGAFQQSDTKRHLCRRV